MKQTESESERCADCAEAAKLAYSDATTPGFFSSKCDKHAQTETESEQATPRPQLVQNARESILARIAKYNDPCNEEWDWDDVHDKWERHALSAVRDLVTVEAERDTMLATNKRLREALKPFANQKIEHFEQGHAEIPDKCPACGPILRARAALKEAE